MSQILPSLVRFIRDDRGAITVDWVVLAAAVSGLGLASVASVREGTGALGSDIASALSGATVAVLGELGSDGYTGPRAIGEGRSRVETSYACPRGSGVCFTTTTTFTSFQMADGSTWTRRSDVNDLPDSEPYVTWWDQDGHLVNDAPRIDV